jgi:hypothetical protein
VISHNLFIFDLKKEKLKFRVSLRAWSRNDIGDPMMAINHIF